MIFGIFCKSQENIYTFMRIVFTNNFLTLNLFPMRKFKFFLQLTLLVLAVFATSCGSKNKTEKESGEPASVIEVSINGMTCTGCEQTIQNRLGKLEGIKSVKASFTTGNAIVEYFPGKVDTLKMKETVTGSGYTVKKFITVQN